MDAAAGNGARAPKAGRRSRRLVVAGIVAGAVLGSAGLAAAGTLPAPVQSRLAAAARLVGVTVPEPGEDRGTRAPGPAPTPGVPAPEIEDHGTPAPGADGAGRHDGTTTTTQDPGHPGIPPSNRTGQDDSPRAEAEDHGAEDAGRAARDQADRAARDAEKAAKDAAKGGSGNGPSGGSGNGDGQSGNGGNGGNRGGGH
jgi:hypothetical protein